MVSALDEDEYSGPDDDYEWNDFEDQDSESDTSVSGI